MVNVRARWRAPWRARGRDLLGLGLARGASLRHRRRHLRQHSYSAGGLRARGWAHQPTRDRSCAASRLPPRRRVRSAPPIRRDRSSSTTSTPGSIPPPSHASRRRCRWPNCRSRCVARLTKGFPWRSRAGGTRWERSSSSRAGSCSTCAGSTASSASIRCADESRSRPACSGPRSSASCAGCSGERRSRGRIAQKQTGADRLSIGGAVAANVHGRGPRMRPIIADVESVTLLDADGELRQVSRSRGAGALPARRRAATACSASRRR